MNTKLLNLLKSIHTASSVAVDSYWPEFSKDECAMPTQNNGRIDASGFRESVC
jgi:hypothetical protein